MSRIDDRPSSIPKPPSAEEDTRNPRFLFSPQQQQEASLFASQMPHSPSGHHNRRGQEGFFVSGNSDHSTSIPQLVPTPPTAMPSGRPYPSSKFNVNDLALFPVSGTTNPDSAVDHPSSPLDPEPSFVPITKNPTSSEEIPNTPIYGSPKKFSGSSLLGQVLFIELQNTTPQKNATPTEHSQSQVLEEHTTATAACSKAMLEKLQAKLTTPTKIFFNPLFELSKMGEVNKDRSIVSGDLDGSHARLIVLAIQAGMMELDDFELDKLAEILEIEAFTINAINKDPTTQENLFVDYQINATIKENLDIIADNARYKRGHRNLILNGDFVHDRLSNNKPAEKKIREQLYSASCTSSIRKKANRKNFFATKDLKNGVYCLCNKSTKDYFQIIDGRKQKLILREPATDMSIYERQLLDEHTYITLFTNYIQASGCIVFVKGNHDSLVNVRNMPNFQNGGYAFLSEDQIREDFIEEWLIEENQFVNCHCEFLKNGQIIIYLHHGFQFPSNLDENSDSIQTAFGIINGLRISERFPTKEALISHLCSEINKLPVPATPYFTNFRPCMIQEFVRLYEHKNSNGKSPLLFFLENITFVQGHDGIQSCSFSTETIPPVIKVNSRRSQHEFCTPTAAIIGDQNAPPPSQAVSADVASCCSIQ